MPSEPPVTTTVYENIEERKSANHYIGGTMNLYLAINDEFVAKAEAEHFG